MRQEVSVSYLAVKSKVYRLIDAMVAGEKTESEIQESIRRWWALIHPLDQPIARKYLMLVLGRSMSTLDAIGDTLASSSGSGAPYPLLSSEKTGITEQNVNEAGVSSAA